VGDRDGRGLRSRAGRVGKFGGTGFDSRLDLAYSTSVFREGPECLTGLKLPKEFSYQNETAAYTPNTSKRHTVECVPGFPVS